jgi:hypothetical protein
LTTEPSAVSLGRRRAWIKTKNRDYWRYEMEREGAFNSRRHRQFV